MMKYLVVLFKDSNCDICKLMQKELMDNPPDADVTVIHLRYEGSNDIIVKENIKEFPTVVIYAGKTEVARFSGFIDTGTIDKIIKEHESKYIR